MKFRSVSLLLLAELATMALWFVSSAILPDMLREVELSPFRQAILSSAVQAGFVLGALAVAFFGLADRYDPRKLFAASAICAGLVNALLLVSEPGGDITIAARFITGALLAGVYPVGMKIMVSWGEKDRGFLIGILVGALTLGSASPQLIALSPAPRTSIRSSRHALPETSIASLPESMKRQSVILNSQKSASSASEALPEKTQSVNSARLRMTLTASSARALTNRHD